MSDVNEQNMEALLEDMQEIQERTVVPATVVSVSHAEAWVSIDAKQDVPILKKELAYPEPDSAEDVVKVGDEINVYVVSKGGEHGYTLSKLKADQEESWKKLDGCVEKKEPLEVTVLKAIKGGLSVSVQGLRGFIPASHVGLHYVQDLSSYEGKVFEALPIEFDAGNHKLVLSRKELLSKEREEAQERVFSTLEAGQTVKVHTGVAMEIDGDKNTVGLIYARSGIATKFGIAPANCVGVIDWDYRGELIVALHNSSENDFVINHGERIAQLVLAPVFTPDVEQVSELSDTARGEGGFGSTNR